MSETINYEQAYTELEGIVSEIEQGEISVDVLSERVKRAISLIKFCKSKLYKTETDVTQLLQDLDSTINSPFDD